MAFPFLVTQPIPIIPPASTACVHRKSESIPSASFGARRFGLLAHHTLTWTSVTNRTYTLEQATNLGGPPAFSVLCSKLAGLPGTTNWTDTNAPVASPRFYQLRVSP
jgi:hypothetical protein